MDRREFTKLVAGGALLGNVSLTGCIGSGAGDYTSWLYNPGEVAELGDMNYGAAYFPEVSELPDSFETGEPDGVEQAIVMGENLSFSGRGSAVVLQTSSISDLPDLDDAVRNQDPQRKYRGYDIYEQSGIGGGISAINENEDEITVIGGVTEAVTEAIIDTRNGEAQPYHQVSEDFGLATQTINGGDLILISEDTTPLNIGNQPQVFGASYSFNDGDVSMRMAFIFPSESAASTVADTVQAEGQVIPNNVGGFSSTAGPDLSSIEMDNVAQSERVVIASLSATYNQSGTSPESNQQEDEELSEDRTVQGRITSSSPRDPVRDSLAEKHTLRGLSGERVEISMEAQFDTYLVVTDSSGAEIARNDDGGSGTNSRLTTTLPSREEYTIWAGSFSGDGTGSYTLSISR